jgi:hypothetical protein
MTIADNHCNDLFGSIIGAVHEIDLDCCTLRNGIEHGLANVKLEFHSKLYKLTKKRLTEEPLIAWLIRKKLTASFQKVDWEVPYPGGDSDKRCDLVVHLDGISRMWIELKLAWKAWFNCIGPPTYSNRAYASYLNGRDRTHSLKHDFQKLLTAHLAASDRRAVCLVGFDCTRSPMDKDVTAVVGQPQQRATWELVAERHWPDRRSPDFRVNIWIWLLRKE